jgi:hypothetical protein
MHRKLRDVEMSARLNVKYYGAYYKLHLIRMWKSVTQKCERKVPVNLPRVTYMLLIIIIIFIIITIIIITIINCSWVVTRWQWLFYMYTKYEAGY